MKSFQSYGSNFKKYINYISIYYYYYNFNSCIEVLIIQNYQLYIFFLKYSISNFIDELYTNIKIDYK